MKVIRLFFMFFQPLPDTVTAHSKVNSFVWLDGMIAHIFEMPYPNLSFFNDWAMW